MNSTLKRLFLFIGFAIFLSTPINAQDYCYVRLGDASGLNTDTYQAGLETATREFIQQYPTLQDSFKVFDFGFYLHQESYQGSFPDVLQQKIDEVASLSPYYLLFGKQTDKTGVYTKFWVDLKLPESGQFQCLDLVASDFRENLGIRIKNHVNNVYQLSNKEPATYAAAEKAALLELADKLNKLSNCCDPGFNPKSGETCYNCPIEGYDILNQMIDADFVLEEIKIIEDGEPSNAPATLNNSSIQKNFSTLDVLISFPGDFEVWDVDNLIDSILINKHTAYNHQRLGITPSIGRHYYKYPRDCNFLEKYEAYKADNSALKFFIGVINIDNKIGLLTYKIGTNANYRDLVKDEVIVTKIHEELDKTLALSNSVSSISEINVQHLNSINNDNFEGLASLESNVSVVDYQLSIDYYRQRRSTYNATALDNYKKLWIDEYGFWGLGTIGQTSPGQQFVNKIMASWNLGTYAVNVNYSILNYQRTFDEIVTELLLEFHCSRETGQSSFEYLKAGGTSGIDYFESNTPFKRLLQDDGITIIKMKFPNTPDGIYSVNTSSVTKGEPYNTVIGMYGRIIRIFGQGENSNFTCEIVTSTEAQSDLLFQKFSIGLGDNFEPDYSTYIDILKSAAATCDRYTAKNIIASFPSCAIDELDNYTRIKLINCLVSESNIGTTEETFIIKLLNTPIDPCEFIELAERASGGLDARNLIQAIDNPITSKELINSFIDIYDTCNNPNGGDDINDSETIFLLKDALSKYGIAFERTHSTINDKNEVSVFIESTSLIPSTSTPYKGPSTIISSGSVSLFSGVTLVLDVGYIQNIAIGSGGVSRIKVPGIAMAFIINNYTKQAITESTTLVLNIALFAVGGLELAIAVKLLRAAQVAQGVTSAHIIRVGLGILDVGSSFADIYCQIDPDASLCDEWRQYGIYVAAGALSVSAIELIAHGNNLAFRLSLIDNEYKNYPNVQKLLGRLDDNKKFSEELRDLLAGFDDNLKAALNNDLQDINSAFFSYLRKNPDGVRAWEVLRNTTWKTEVAFLTELSEDLGSNPQLRQFFNDAPEYLDLWKTGIRTSNTDELIEFAGRAGLRDEYIDAVQAISNTADDLRTSGMAVEDIAQEVFQIRRNTTIEYKNATPNDLLNWIFNNIRYTQTGLGDQWGLTWEGALQHYSTDGVVDYEKIISGASRPLGDKQQLGQAFFNVIGDAVLPVLQKYRMTDLIE